MSSFLSSSVLGSVAKPKGRIFAYGTAGFREDASLLDSTFFRMGMLAALRAAQKGDGLATGVMITASHNKASDNGIKLVDKDGGMLEQSWEIYCTLLANAEDGKVGEALQEVIKKEGIDVSHLAAATVFIGRDTRESSTHLKDLTVKGVAAVGGKTVDYGLLTTPQLHHIVKMVNAGGEKKAKWGSEAGYYAMLAEAYEGLVGAPKSRTPLFIDCANGVGGIQIPKVHAALSKYLDIKLFNAGEGELNHNCGAEHLQKARLIPENTDLVKHLGQRMASVDGDADRLVYWFLHPVTKTFQLLDGDAIAVLAGRFIYEQLNVLEIKDSVKVGVVQTAYANGAAGAYLRKEGVPLGMAKTGVKFVHHEALHYDIGIYFEANGHGTVLFKDELVEKLRKIQSDPATTGAKAVAVSRLLWAQQLINQAVGDAITDFLFVEAILSLYGWDLKEWAALYTDLPSRQDKIKVKDRSVVTTIPDESRALSPPGLQEAIDALVAKHVSGRAFVRPSGTEDAVRIYAEADTQANADILAKDVARALYRLAGGVGTPP